MSRSSGASTQPEASAAASPSASLRPWVSPGPSLALDMRRLQWEVIEGPTSLAIEFSVLALESSPLAELPGSSPGQDYSRSHVLPGSLTRAASQGPS